MREVMGTVKRSDLNCSACSTVRSPGSNNNIYDSVSARLNTCVSDR